MEFLKLIIESNLFNFLIMIAIIAYVAKKFNFAQKLDDAILKVKETIENSELAKTKSIEELKQANEQTQNVGLETEQIKNQGQENLSNMKEKIISDSEKQINSIKKNADKITEAKEKEIVSNLSKKTVIASYETAKKHIIHLLKENPDFHQKFIKESIQELDRLK